MKPKLKSKIKPNLKKLQDGGKPSFENFYKTVNPDFNDTSVYDLRGAYNELPYKTLQAWQQDPERNHLPDTYKLPNHPTFSIESQYYKPGMKAGYWDEDNYVPLPAGKLAPKKFADGGTNPPIITHDPNDPRIQAYQDSLSTSNIFHERESLYRNNQFANQDQADSAINHFWDNRYYNPNLVQQYPTTHVRVQNRDGSHFIMASSTSAITPVQPYQYTPDTRPKLDLPTLQPRKPGKYELYKEGDDNNPDFSFAHTLWKSPSSNYLTVDTPPDPQKVPLPYFTREPQDQERGHTEYFDKKTGKKLEFGGSFITSKSNDMKTKSKIPLKLKKYGGILKADNGVQTPKVGGDVGDPSSYYFQNQGSANYVNPNSEVDQQTNADYIQHQQTNFNAKPINLQGQEYNYNYQTPNVGDMNNPASYQIGDNQTTNGQPLNPNSQIVDPSNKNAGIYPDAKKQTGLQKLKTGWSNANYTNQFGHSGNYWADFASNQWRATDALAHAIPDSIGDAKSNKFTKINEANTDKNIMNPYLSTVPQKGTGQQLRKFGGSVNDLKTYENAGTVEVEGKEGIKTPDGMIGNITGASHAEGGIPIDAEGGTKIYSEKLKHPETGKSYAKMMKPLNTKKEDEIIADPKMDKIAKETAQMQKQKKMQEADRLFALQEKNKLSGVHGADVQKQTQEDYMPEMQAGMGAYIPALQTMEIFEHPMMHSGGEIPDLGVMQILERPMMQRGGEIPLEETMAIFEHPMMKTGGEIPLLKTMHIFEHPMMKNGGMKKAANGIVKSSQDDHSVTPTGVVNPNFTQADWEDWQQNILQDNSGYGNPRAGINFPLDTKSKVLTGDASKYMLNKEQDNPEGRLNAAYQEQYYDRLLDTEEGRRQLATMWDKNGLTNFGKQLGLDKANIPFGTLSTLSDKELTNHLNSLRPAYIEGILSSRKAGDIPYSKLPVGTTQTTPLTGDKASEINPGTYNSVNKKNGRFGMLPTIVGVPNPQVDAPVSFRHISPNPIDYRPESNIGEINEIQGATAKLSRFLPTTSEGVGDAANMAANAYQSINKSNENIYNINQKGKLGVDEANQRNLQGVNEFNAKNDLEQLNHITGREQLKNVQSQTDRKEALNQINTNTQFSNTADFLGRTINPSDYYGGGADLTKEVGLTGKESADEARRKIVKYQYEKEFGKVERTGAETTQTKKFGGKIKAKLPTKIVKKKSTSK